MDDPYPILERDRATWQSEAEKQAVGERRRWRRLAGIALAVIVAIAIVIAGIVYWLHARQFESTDDAFVDGYMTQMAPQVAGRVIALRFADNAHVTAGQTLLLIDPRD